VPQAIGPSILAEHASGKTEEEHHRPSGA